MHVLGSNRLLPKNGTQKSNSSVYHRKTDVLQLLWGCPFSDSSPFLLSQKTGGQAVVLRAWGVSLSAGGGAVQSSLCITAEWKIPVYLCVLGWPSCFRKVFWPLRVPLARGCKEMLQSLPESECHLQDLHAAPRILHLKRMWGTDI